MMSIRPVCCIFTIFVFFGSIRGLRAENTLIRGRSSKIGDATHLEFQGRAQWDYEIERKDKKTIILRVPSFDEATEILLKSYQDELIKSINVDKNEVPGTYKITIDLRSEKVETFDYLTDEPSRLIVDLYKVETVEQQKKDVKTQEIKKEKVTPFSEQRIEGEYQTIKKLPERDPAGEIALEAESDDQALSFPMAGVFDGGDPQFARFRMKDYEIKEEAIIAAQQNIYIRFPFLKMAISKLQDLLFSSAEYSINPKNTEENKEARFILHLAEKKREHPFSKAYNHFIKKYPNSKYDEIVRNVAAEFYFKLYLKNPTGLNFKKVEDLYAYLLNKYPQSIIAERNMALLAYAYLERGDALKTLQYFKQLLSKFPETNHRDQARKAMSEAYLKLNKFDEARAILEDLIKNANDPQNRIEAEFRIGDVYIVKKDFAKAEEAYLSALKNHPEADVLYPNLYYNLAESYFWRPKYKESLDRFVDFLERFPDHPYGAYAMTRIGELLQILGADQTKYMGAFLESSYRFRNAPGARVSQVRMMSQRMKSMKENELRKALADLDEIRKENKLPRNDEFVTLMISDGFSKRGDFVESMKYLIDYYQKNPTSADLDFFKKRIVQNIAALLNERIEGGEALDALKTYEKYESTWLKGHNRIDLKIFLGRAYQKLGVYSEAEKNFKKAFDQLRLISGSQEEFERRVNEFLPSVDELILEIAIANFNQNKLLESQEHLKKLDDFKKLSLNRKIQAITLQSQLYKKKKQWPMAIKTLNVLIQQIEDSPEKALLYFDLALILNDIGEFDQGLKNVKKGLQLDPNSPVGLEIEGDLLVKLNRPLEAVASFKRFLQTESGKANKDQLNFKIGDLLYESGDLNAAEKIWRDIDRDRQPLLFRLAQEKLDSARWQDDYQKYIDRIPAMTTQTVQPEKESE